MKMRWKLEIREQEKQILEKDKVFYINYWGYTEILTWNMRNVLRKELATKTALPLKQLRLFMIKQLRFAEIG